MSKIKLSFKLIYLIYFAVLVTLVIAATGYVNGLLHDYEHAQPERSVRDVMVELSKDAAGNGFWEKYQLSSPQAGTFESGIDIKQVYLALYAGELTFAAKGGLHAEDELFYYIKNGDLPLAEVKLKAAGPTVTKLAVLSMREWNVESVTPLIEPHSYTVTLPSSFSMKVNGIPLTAENGTVKNDGEILYTIPDVYLEPEFLITDKAGNQAQYTVKNNRILVEYYNYSLTLPADLKVTLDGAIMPGTAAGDDLLRYDVTQLAKPALQISDQYGNVINYDGGDKLPLTYVTIHATDLHTVKVGEIAVSPVSLSAHPDYVHFTKYAEGLPQKAVYTIAALSDSADISVTDRNGTNIPLEEGLDEYDLTAEAGLDTVPAEVSAEIDLLSVAQNWSLFMSNDLKFSKLSGNLITGSYQYEVARKYATGIDITFISNHVLLDPAFTENSVTNFRWITDKCFSVDISFVKHMRLTRTGQLVDDEVNDRFYFVKYDDTVNGVNDPVWKLASMKEIINDAGA